MKLYCSGTADGKLERTYYVEIDPEEEKIDVTSTLVEEKMDLVIRGYLYKGVNYEVLENGFRREFSISIDRQDLTFTIYDIRSYVIEVKIEGQCKRWEPKI